MADRPHSDEDLLKRIGLSDADLRDMQAKFSNFFGSLNEAQKKSLRRSLPTSADAAATLGPDVTPQTLEDFIKRRTTGPYSTTLFNEQCGDD